MNDDDPRDDMGSPYDPDTPEGFLEMMQHHFDKWWNSLNPPRSFNGVSLERETARATWNAAGDHFWHHLETVYDCMKGSSEVWKQNAHHEAGYLVSQFSGDSYSFKLDNYMDWHFKHSDHVRREYHNGTITITYRPKPESESESESELD